MTCACWTSAARTETATKWRVSSGPTFSIGTGTRIDGISPTQTRWIHCGFTRADAPEDQFRAESDNIAMAYNVYQTCLEENVRRVVVVSSNHAADFYETLIWSGPHGIRDA